jgi:hypothetical protein
MERNSKMIYYFIESSRVQFYRVGFVPLNILCKAGKYLFMAGCGHYKCFGTVCSCYAYMFMGRICSAMRMHIYLWQDMSAIHVSVKDVPAINACLCAGCVRYSYTFLCRMCPLYKMVSVQDVPAIQNGFCAGCARYTNMFLCRMWPIYKDVSVQDVSAIQTCFFVGCASYKYMLLFRMCPLHPYFCAWFACYIYILHVSM